MDTMDFNAYQIRARETAIYPNIDHNWEYVVLGLVGEAGELANKCKKIQRDDRGVITDQKREEIKDELGDILWYIANTAAEFHIDFDAIAVKNLMKLQDRRSRDKISGFGDNR